MSLTEVDQSAAEERDVRANGVRAAEARRLVHASGTGPTARGGLSPRASVVPVLVPDGPARPQDRRDIRRCAPSGPSRGHAARGDQAVQRGTKTRPSRLATRKNDEAYVLDITPDILAAVDLAHQSGLRRGGVPLLEVQRLCTLHRQPRPAAQAGAGEARAPFAQPPQGGEALGRDPRRHQRRVGQGVQAQLGHRSEQSTHKYAHPGSGAQKRLIETLKPKAAPREAVRSAHVNVGSTSEAQASTSDLHVKLRSTVLVANANAVA
jgi:hypothetical protein